MNANVVGATVPITFLGDANLFVPVTFPWSVHLLIGILRRWSCIVSLMYFMDLTYLLDILQNLLKCVLYDIKFEVINNGFGQIISCGEHTIIQVSICFSLLFSQFYKVHLNGGLAFLDFVFLVVLFCPL